MALNEIVANDICCGCGTCAGICPNNAVKMKVSEGLFIPEVDETKCSKCGLCVKTCPGNTIDYGLLQKQVFSQDPEDPAIGNALFCYIGFATDNQIRYSSTSGGIITQLLIFALESKVIDGAIVTRMREDNPLVPEAFIARTREEIIEAANSKYCPVATNVCLRQVLKEEGRYAIVGLPCHLKGIRKAEAQFPLLKKRIVMHLGLLCSHTVDFAGIHFLMKKIGVKNSEVRKIAYRGNGWPGSLSIETKSGARISRPLVGSWHAYWPLFSSFFFTPMRCTMCPDQAAELADLSFGDAWLPELKHEKDGTSIIISRTAAGQDLLEKAQLAGTIVLKQACMEKVAQSQSTNLKFKKQDLPSRLTFMHMMGRKTPQFVPNISYSVKFISGLRTIYVYLSIKASSNRHFRSLLLHTPFPLIRLYYGLYKSLCII